MPHLTWTLGDAKITQIVETAADAVLAQLLGATPTQLQQYEVLTPHFINADGTLRGWFQSFIIEVGGQTLLLEGGIGNGRERPGFPGMHQLQTDFLTQFDPAAIDLVIPSHLHIDHVGWFTRPDGDRWVPTFPNARYLIVQAEYDFWKDRKAHADQMRSFEECVAPLVTAGVVDFVDATHQVNNYLRLSPAPGHTAHHVVMTLTVGDQRALFSGDVFPHPSIILNPTLEFGSDYDPAQAVTTREGLLRDLADRDTLLFSPHFADPVAVRITSAEEGYSFVLA